MALTSRRPLEEVVTDRTRWPMQGKVATSAEDARLQISEREDEPSTLPYWTKIGELGLWAHQTPERALAHAEHILVRAKRGEFVDTPLPEDER